MTSTLALIIAADVLVAVGWAFWAWEEPDRNTLMRHSLKRAMDDSYKGFKDAGRVVIMEPIDRWRSINARRESVGLKPIPESHRYGHERGCGLRYGGGACSCVRAAQNELVNLLTGEVVTIVATRGDVIEGIQDLERHIAELKALVFNAECNMADVKDRAERVSIAANDLETQAKSWADD